MKTFAIKTLGCKTNQLEEAMIIEQLIKNDWKQLPFNETANLYIINSCSVTSNSDKKSQQLIAKIKKTFPHSKILVTGCYAQLSAEEIKELGVDFVLGNNEKKDIANFLEKHFDEGFKVVYVGDVFKEKTFSGQKISSSGNRTRANVKVQDGCNYRCSYCIIPFARGTSRSKPLDTVIEEIRDLTLSGYKEIILTGINLGSYGKDLKTDFKTLILELEKIETLQRYRISSLNPNDIDDSLIEIFANSKKFARHLHISYQSLSDKILKLMKRPYSADSCIVQNKKLSTQIDGIFISCDIIAGFPAETEEDFELTLNCLKSMNLGYIHAFPYSARKNTPAEQMRHQVDEKLKNHRCKLLNTLALEKNSAFKQNFLGKELSVLIEKKRHKSGKLKGLSDNYITVLIDGNDKLKNTIINVSYT